MKFKAIVFTLLMSFGLNIPVIAQEEYKIHIGDCLNINVVGYEEFSVDESIAQYEKSVISYKVRSDGKITLPLLGDVSVINLAPSELAKILMEQLKTYLTDPKVFVAVLSEGTTRVYLLGEIKHPGLYELKKSRTVLDAISVAGSWTNKTAKKKIYLIRKGKDEEPIKINLKKMLETGDMEQNYELNEGDVLYFKGNSKLFCKNELTYL